MLTAKRVFDDTPEKTKQSAGTDVIQVTYAVKAAKDAVFGRPYAEIHAGARRNPPKGSGRIHKVELRMYDKQSMESDIWASCSCESWCVAKYSRVASRKGLMSIGEISNTQQIIDNKDNQQRVIDIFLTGRQPTYCLTTERNYQLRATLNEKFLVLTPQLDLVWKRLDTIQSGDYVTLKRGAVLPEQSPTFEFFEYTSKRKRDYQRMIAGKMRHVTGSDCNGYQDIKCPERMTKPLAYVLGYLISEGNTTDNAVSFGNKNPEVIDHYVRCWDQCFPGAHLTFSDHRGTMQASCRSVVVQQFLAKACGYLIGVKCKKLKIPDVIFQCNAEHISAFLRALFEGDGSRSQTQFSYHSASRRLVSDVQQLLLYMGIASGVNKVPYSGTLPDGKPNSIYGHKYTVVLSGEDALAFSEHIGFITKDESLPRTIGIRGRYIPYVTSAIHETIRSCRVKYGVYLVNGERVKANLYKHSMFSDRSSTGASEKYVRSYLQDYGADLLKVFPELHAKLEYLLHSDLIWLKVKHIKGLKEVETYDAHEEKDHHFIANGFVVHNTYRSEITWATKGSSDIIYTKDHPTLPYIRNPKGLVWACPHVLHILSYALFDKRVAAAIEEAKALEKPAFVEEEPLKAPKKPAKKKPAKKKAVKKKPAKKKAVKKKPAKKKATKKRR